VGKEGFEATIGFNNLWRSIKLPPSAFEGLLGSKTRMWIAKQLGIISVASKVRP